MYRVFGMSASGNCYKVKLLLEQLQAPYQWDEIDIMKGTTRQAAFLTKNPNGRVPILEIEPGKYLAESNAILGYLAEGTPYWPGNRFDRAEALQWMFFEQYSHEPYIAVARFIRVFLPPDHPRHAEIPRLHERGYQALGVMEQHLARRQFFTGGTYSISDIALYAYTHNAAEGGFDLGRFPAVNAWLERVTKQPRFVAMA